MTDQQPASPPAQTAIPVEVISRGGPRRIETIDLLDAISHMMDRCFEVPGSKARFGINSILLLMPGIGDVIAGAISTLILTIALSSYQVPRIVAARMVMNTLLDSLISAIPLVGNLWDVWFKADTRNVNLLRPYISLTAEKPPSTWGHWAFVIGMVLLLVLVLGLIVTGGVVLVVALVKMLQGPAA